jgi:WD40 repeat protein
VTAKFSDDGRRLIVAGVEQQILVWDVGVEIVEPSPRVWTMDRFAEDAVISPDGKWLASGYNSQELWLLRIDDATAPQDANQPVQLKGHTNGICEFKFSPDSRWLFTGGDNEGMLWDLSTSDIQSSRVKLPIRKKTSFHVVRAQFSDDGEWVATNGASVMIWRLPEDGLLQMAKELAHGE